MFRGGYQVSATSGRREVRLGARDASKDRGTKVAGAGAGDGKDEEIKTNRPESSEADLKDGEPWCGERQSAQAITHIILPTTTTTIHDEPPARPCLSLPPK